MVPVCVSVCTHSDHFDYAILFRHLHTRSVSHKHTHILFASKRDFFLRFFSSIPPKCVVAFVPLDPFIPRAFTAFHPARRIVSHLFDVYAISHTHSHTLIYTNSILRAPAKPPKVDLSAKNTARKSEIDNKILKEKLCVSYPRVRRLENPLIYVWVFIITEPNI